MLTVPTTAELATFTGRIEGSFSAFAPQALEQAALMFSIVTKLSDYPADPDLAKLAQNAIMEMADRLLLEQPYQAIKAGPFQSETIASYSYSRTTQTAGNAVNGLKVGLFWWDLAVDELTVPGQSVLAHGSIQSRVDGIYSDGEDGLFVVTAAEEEGVDRPPYIRIS